MTKGWHKHTPELALAAALTEATGLPEANGLPEAPALGEGSVLREPDASPVKRSQWGMSFIGMKLHDKRE